MTDPEDVTELRPADLREVEINEADDAERDLPIEADAAEQRLDVPADPDEDLTG